MGPNCNIDLNYVPLNLRPSQLNQFGDSLESVLLSQVALSLFLYSLPLGRSVNLDTQDMLYRFGLVLQGGSIRALLSFITILAN